MSIYKMTTYVDDNNRTVMLKESLEGRCSYMGSVIVQTPKGLLPIEFPFPQDESEMWTIELCFEKFDDELKAYIEKVQRERATQIITPENSGNIIHP